MHMADHNHKINVDDRKTWLCILHIPLRHETQIDNRMRSSRRAVIVKIYHQVPSSISKFLSIQTCFATYHTLCQYKQCIRSQPVNSCHCHLQILNMINTDLHFSTVLSFPSKVGMYLLRGTQFLSAHHYSLANNIGWNSSLNIEQVMESTYQLPTAHQHQAPSDIWHFLYLSQHTHFLHRHHK